MACRLRLADSPVCLFLPPFPPYLRARQSQRGLTSLGGPTGLALDGSFSAGLVNTLAWWADAPRPARVSLWGKFDTTVPRLVWASLGGPTCLAWRWAPLAGQFQLGTSLGGPTCLTWRKVSLNCPGVSARAGLAWWADVPRFATEATFSRGATSSTPGPSMLDA